MKKVLCLIIASLMLLCGCSDKTNSAQPTPTSDDYAFTINNNNIVSKSGVEYSCISKRDLCYLGDLEFIGSIQGEEKTSQHLSSTYTTGMFAIKNTNNENILIRFSPNNEWSTIYRNTSLPEYDFSVDNCIRLEFVSGLGDILADQIHTTCNDGITDESQISAFLSEVRAQKNPHDAGLYDLIKQPDGMLENCYSYGIVYGFFEEETNLAIKMNITSYNDLAYSIDIEDHHYVLPEQWLQTLENK